MPDQPRPTSRDRQRRGAPARSCERCGFVLRLRAPWVQTEHCPRCLATAHTEVTLVPLRRRESGRRDRSAR